MAAPRPAGAAEPDLDRDPRIALFPADLESDLRDFSVPIWDREEGVVIVGLPSTQLDILKNQGIEPIWSAPDHGEAIHVLSHDRTFSPPDFKDMVRFQINESAMLYLIPAGLKMELPRVKFHALFHGVPRVALAPIRVHPADLEGVQASLAPIGLVQQIVDATSQASWFQFVRDLSGDSDVTIPGFCTNCRIRTRASNYMFPLNNTGTPLGNPFATEYLENKAAGWGFVGPNATRESYTSANSGCTTRQGSQTWQNVVFTLPGQVDYAQNQQVIFVVHYDTISESAANDANNAPGADDAISGGTALLEAMRLFKDYAWRFPVKFLFVSGEEVGLCGSTAYTRMHPTAPMWRVLNMDQTAFDGNKNGLMNLYNWSTASCPSCVAFGDAFVQANSDYGTIIDPAKIVRNTTKMCQTDHCPFWNVGVTAIDLNEDLTNNDICPCFDQFQTATCRDTVTQFYPVASTTLMFDQNYSWPTEKAAIALIAHTAEPLYACPAAGATLSSATPGTGQIALSWADVPPVTNYVVERADGGCGGTFAGIASNATAGYTDAAVTAGSTYGYRIRTCPFQVSNCVAATVPGSPTPTTVTFTAVAAQDGWVLESGENTSVGGSIDATASNTSALRVGDNNQDRQYKSVVSFDTSSIPDGATIVSVTLRLLRGTSSGTSPFTTHGTCWVDVQGGSGFSGSTTLQTGDFQAAATAVHAASLSNAASNGTWSEGSLNAAGLAAINKTGTTQLRAYFNLDDNDDTANDYLGYYSGNNGTAANRPQLVVTYQ
ncbi:MAG TPA: M20/M25/M40 family metallo-hydrolase [Thermoanaerobaculia bacterium]|nr:M20/M25/M40 family metallo-hydrolase [Thermoanaerobaculia bacterium]